jgi:hypothetical protein
VIGNSLKAGIRFVAFDTYKTLLEDAEGNISGPRTVIAGFGAGITESLLAVTPFESIKTTLCVLILHLPRLLVQGLIVAVATQHRRPQVS